MNRSWRIARRVCAAVMLAGCSLPPPSPQVAAPLPAPLACADTGSAATPQDASALADLRRSVEAGPLYAAAAIASNVSACRVERGSGATTTLEYQFRDGGRLHVKRDARIEYTEQEARFASPPAEPAPALLARAERAAFGANGCGIDWRQPPETRAAEAEPGATDSIFRGDVCNCQARIRRDAAGRVVALALKSTC